MFEKIKSEMCFKKKTDPGIKQLKRHESLRLKMYKCTAGANSIAYGHNLDINPISEAAADLIFQDDLNIFIPEVKKNFPFYKKLNSARQWVLINMAFNLGIRGLKKFKNTLKYIEAGEFEKAAKNMLLSRWAGQVGNRATELSMQMKSGLFINQ